MHVVTAAESLSFFRGQETYFADHGMQLSFVSGTPAASGRSVHVIPMKREPSLRHDIEAVRALARLFRERRPDIVHAHTPKAGLVAMMAATWVRRPVRVFTLHGLRSTTARGLQRVVLSAAEAATCRMAQRVFAVSPSLRDEAVARRICTTKKCVVIGGGSISGVDVERFRGSVETRIQMRASLGIPVGASVIGFVGRLVRDKGVGELAQAWARVRSTFCDAYLLTVGPVEAGDPLPAHVVDALRADDRVRMVDGWQEEVAPYYAAMDVVALPSHREGFGLVALEASAAGLPVVASRIAGCVDAVADGVTGTLVEKGNEAALAEAIGRYLRDSALRKAHGGAGMERARREFDQATLWRALADEYLALVARRR